MASFSCFQCGDRHKARADKFPKTVVNTKIGKHRERIDTIVGYICKKCSGKNLVKSRAKGVSWRQALREMFKKKDTVQYV